ncbi:hypothetical protein T440DRAFT_220008 [Plenodomus tracheiphilus IPT5]|uniref:Uncharacterized protein n=1 Tax=Plenodomus tracheiphilus IPT5 TaxID=1408161 RepID=A0A6A7AXL5_9PLEO|nr:hypothetical protein T440DRAFT_220008 [Plenodomus tracheiphilus IPT5]
MNAGGTCTCHVFQRSSLVYVQVRSCPEFGCDGVGSVVRRSMGWELDGGPTNLHRPQRSRPSLPHPESTRFSCTRSGGPVNAVSCTWARESGGKCIVRGIAAYQNIPIGGRGGQVI